MSYKLSLDAKKIENKKFDLAPVGYPPNDVNIFLDLVISDYQEIEKNQKMYEKKIIVLTEKLQEIEKTSQQLKDENEALKKQIQEMKPDRGTSHIELLKRVGQNEDAISKIVGNINQGFETISKQIKKIIEDK